MDYSNTGGESDLHITDAMVLEPLDEEVLHEMVMDERVEDPGTDGEHNHSHQPSTLTVATTIEIKPPRKKTAASSKLNQAAEINEKMLRMEAELESCKEKLYQEYMNEIINEMKGIQDGTSPEYEERLQMLIEDRDATIYRATTYREYLLEISERIFDEEVAQAEQDYERERQDLIEKLLADVEERRKRLKEEQANYDLMHDSTFEASTRQNSRKLRERIGIKEYIFDIQVFFLRPTPSVKVAHDEYVIDLAEMWDDPLNPSKKSTSSHKKKNS
ncbi:11778_t:CDS:2 [Ambispora gerdemannii]|uniref:11778_t:CDS:1 n=1 Tax=Ambispora gerdemannii TaxID=144530 RepID=A0A9N8ZW42_9GLOM|nr:11778_t:CDS:2 [Ambispora gerdemannii]